MNIGKFLRSLAPLSLIAVTTALAGCDDSTISVNGDKGKPLAQLDLSGPPPHALALFGPDKVDITSGDKLTIKVDGPADAAAQLRFTLKDGTLGILREHAIWSSDGTALTIHVTMPPPDQLVMMGSGTINAAALADKADVSIAGSGDVAAAQIGASKLTVGIAGSGNFHGGGHVADLDLNIGGSGTADLAALHADKAEVNIAGSGNSSFASDGTVTANILGSGAVTVKGRAHCTVSTMGSGKLVCEPGDGQGVQAAVSPRDAAAASEDQNDGDGDDSADDNAKPASGGN